jgi:hypothetical protein
MPNAPRHTVHDVVLEQAPADDIPGSIRALARVHSKAAFQVLIDVMGNAEVTAATRVIAAIAVLDRGCGKPRRASDDDAPDPLRLETIRQIIVDPGHPDRESIPAAAETGAL